MFLNVRSKQSHERETVCLGLILTFVWEHHHTVEWDGVVSTFVSQSATDVFDASTSVWASTSCLPKPSCSHHPLPSYLAPQQKKEVIVFDWAMPCCYTSYLCGFDTNTVKLLLPFYLYRNWGPERFSHCPSLLSFYLQSPVSESCLLTFESYLLPSKPMFCWLLYAILPLWLYFYLSEAAWC